MNHTVETSDVSEHSTKVLFVWILFAGLDYIEVVFKDHSVRMKWAH